MDIEEWAKGWGPECEWDSTAEDWVANIQKLPRQEAKEQLDDLFVDWRMHARDGRELLKRVKSLTLYLDHTDRSPTELQALFLDGYNMVTTVLSEVKFFELKLDEFAPLQNRATACSTVRYYGS